MKAGPMHAGDLVTVGRAAATPLFAWTLGRALENPGRGGAPALLFVLIAASDCLDGWLARRAASESERGRVLDSVADIVFLMGALGAAVWGGVVPWWVPAAIAGSFAFYVADSWKQTRGNDEPGLIGSRAGHAAGVCNYAVVGVVTFNNGCGLGVLDAAALQAVFLLVPVYSALAVISRLAARPKAV